MPGLAGHAEAQGKRLPRRSAAIAFFARHLTHAGIEKPGALRAGLFAVAGVGRGEIPIRQSLLKDSASYLAVQGSALGLLVFFVPAQAEPLEAFEN